MIPACHDQDDRLLTPALVAKRLQVNRETVYRWMKAGDLRYIEPRAGGVRPRKLIRESEVSRHLQEHEP
jgi:excisionase family DNA binding protein